MRTAPDAASLDHLRRQAKDLLAVLPIPKLERPLERLT